MPPVAEAKRPLKRTRLSPVERRAQLIDCAIAACAEYGLARVTHSHIAERSGISVPAVHSYFRTRDDLVAAVLEVVEQELSEIVLGLLTAQGPVRDCMDNLADRFQRLAREEPDKLKVWLDWSTGVGADIWPRYVALNDQFLDAANRLLIRGKREGVIVSGLDTRAAARLYIGGGHTVVLMQFAGVSKRDIDAYNAQLIDMIVGQKN